MTAPRAATAAAPAPDRLPAAFGRPQVEFPDQGRVAQDAETVRVLGEHGGWQQVRLHDYAALFAVPGLYETVFSETLGCDSPRIVTDELAAVLDQDGIDRRDLRALDLGAGNGMVAEHLHRHGVGDVVGVDRLPEAALAAARDRPGLYRRYVVGDVTGITASDVADRGGRAPNLLVCVAALGFGDLPVAAFGAALDLLAPGSWVAFNVKTAFLGDDDPTGFALLLAEKTMYGQLALVRDRTYVHRRSQSGEPLYYTSIVARTG